MQYEITIKDEARDEILNKFEIECVNENQAYNAMPLIAQSIEKVYKKKGNFRGYDKKGACIFLTDYIISD